jgi:hypothetical protein
MSDMNRKEREFLAASINTCGDACHRPAEWNTVDEYAKDYAVTCIKRALRRKVSIHLTEEGIKMANTILNKLRG